ncbi:tetratricopeptide repeat protein [Bartonella sp. CB178]|uniref:tetratricopeptide repeat protein n=1 Tax=Bartonella sp. CB178 TaxID=3112255 RepID=UPI00300DC451
MEFFVFLEALRSGNFSVFRYFLFTCVGVFLSVSSVHSQDFFESPFEEHSPRSLLPLGDLIPGSPSSPSANSNEKDAISEEFDAVRHLQGDRAKQRKEAEISRLLKELKFCADVRKARTISQQLQRLWSQSGSETIDLLMAWAERAIGANDYGLALDYIDNVVALFPDYAEAWVRRAWIHIQFSDFKLAMLDLNHAISLEPRNYIAFFELGVVMESTDRPQLAIKAYETALHYYPQMQKLQKRVSFLIDKRSPQAI